MADLDYTTTIDNGFEISLGDSSLIATGNKFLSNRFTITFLTNTRQYLINNDAVTDSYGGDAGKYIGPPKALNNIQSIATSISVAMDKTVESIKSSQSTVTDPTEKLSGAKLKNVYIKDNIVYAVIQIIPMKYSSSNELYFSVPIRGV